MNGCYVYTHGPHQYRFTKEPDGVGFEYALFGCNGTTEAHRPGQPNAHPWRKHSRVFDTVRDASEFAMKFFTQRKEND